MPTRRDQLHAYQFMMRRVTSALIVHETDPEVTPLRRGVGAVFAGVMIAVLVAAGFGVYGVFTGVGGTSWKKDGSVIVEKETGAPFVYQGGSLQPVLNVASARLLGSAQNPEPQQVAGEDLAGLPRKPVVGIPGAPASLPPADRIAGPPWTMCSVLSDDPSGAPTTTSMLLVGTDLSGGAQLGQRGLLARDSTDGQPYLVWNNHRFRISGDSQAVLRSLFGASAEFVDVGTAWLNGLPAGQDIGPISIDGKGQASSVDASLAVGDIVYHPVGGGVQNYLVRADGFAPLTELQVQILRGQYSVTPKQIPASLANSAPVSNALAPPTGSAAPPPAPPQLVGRADDGHMAMCARTEGASSAPVVTLGGDETALGAGVQTSAKSSAGTKLADRVLVPPGKAAVVRARISDGAGALSIVTDLGLRFPVPSPKVLQALGYSESDAVDMPAALVQRIPTGPTLDPAAAGAAAPAGP